MPFVASRGHNLTNEGGVVLELEPDMVTIKTGPDLLFPIKGKPGAFKDHAFFEASSIRKIDGKYCFVYSSEHNHELCYAMSDSPKGPFTYGGTLVDLGDLYLENNIDENRASNYLGNTHGGMVEIHGQWYIFYHRQTNRSSYARQGCAEKLERTPDKGFRQAEVTSCGLNGGAPKKKFAKHPYFTQTGKDREKDGDQYIANMRDGSAAGFKYFQMGKANYVSVEVKGDAAGKIQVSDQKDFSEIHAEIPIRVAAGITKCFGGEPRIEKGIKALFFRYKGEGAVDFLAFELKGRGNEKMDRKASGSVGVYLV